MQLLTDYFQEGWQLSCPTAEERLDQMLAETPLERQRLCAAEIGRVLDRGLCENQVRDLLLYELGCSYVFEADGLDPSSWLRHVQQRLIENASRRNGR